MKRYRSVAFFCSALQWRKSIGLPGPADRNVVSRFILPLILLPVCVGQTGGNWLDRQKAAHERQRESVAKALAAGEAHASSITRQMESASKQKSSAKPVESWEWSPAAKAVLEITPIALGCTPPGIADFEGLIRKHAMREGLNEALVRAVVRKESGFNPCAVSRAGAQGLMQLMPETAEHLGVGDPFDPEQNLAAGSKFLKMLLDRYGGNLSLALGAYNAGPGRVDRLGRVPAIQETQDYVRTILKEVGDRNPLLE